MVRVGRLAEARRLFRRLLGAPDLSNHVRSDVLRQIAGIELGAGRFRRARRLLAAAIRLRRHADELYVQYARVASADPDADPRLAVKALRRAVGIDPHEAGSWAALGTAAVRAGEVGLARKAFRRAARLRPDVVDTLNEVADGLIEIGLVTEARSVLIAARFRSPGDANVLSRVEPVSIPDGPAPPAAGRFRPRHHPAVRGECREPSPVPGAPVVLRADRQSAPTPHLLRMFGQRFDPRRAQ